MIQAGQGMNVSMMDSYNLAWKLAHSINGLTADSAVPGKPDGVVDTYHTERHTIARELISFDKAFSSMFSGKIGVAAEDGGLSHKQFLEVFSTGNGFTSGCGIEYPENLTVWRTFDCEDDNPIVGTDFLSGTLRPGRRLLNVKVKRFADGCPRDLQDGIPYIHPSIQEASKSHRLTDWFYFLDFPSTGRFRILCLTSTDLLEPEGTSAQTLTAISTSVLPRFPPSLLEQVVVHPRVSSSCFEWKDLPAAVKQHSEMRFFSGYEMDDVYGIYGVEPARGALAVVRPDGYVGVTARLDDLGRVVRYLEGCLRRCNDS